MVNEGFKDEWSVLNDPRTLCKRAALRVSEIIIFFSKFNVRKRKCIYKLACPFSLARKACFSLSRENWFSTTRELFVNVLLDD